MLYFTKNIANVVSAEFLRRQWIRIAMLFLLVAAVLGSILRLMFVVELNTVSYKYILHAHSHVAMLGWAFLVVSGSMIFLLDDRTKMLKEEKKIVQYGIILLVSAISTVGMTVGFIIQGYAAVSIAFSAVHVLNSYFFAYCYLRDIRLLQLSTEKSLLKMSVVWMLVSSVGVWLLPVVVKTVGKLHPLYSISIQLFLHLQCNGWFLYAVLGLLVWYLSAYKTIVIARSTQVILHISVLLTYALSITWSSPADWLFWLNSLGVVLQTVAYIRIFTAILPVLISFGSKQRLPMLLMLSGVYSLMAKAFIQFAVVVPEIAVVGYTIRSFVIGFLHMLLLGGITLSVGGIVLATRIVPIYTVAAYSGWKLLALAFILTELLLFGQGLFLWLGIGFIPLYHEMLLLCTLLLPISVMLLNISLYRHNKYHVQAQYRANVLL